MKKQRIHIVLLVLVQLLVFVAPHVIKASHHHANRHYNHDQAGNGTTLSKASTWCPICKFEFVTSLSNEENRFSLFQPASRIEDTALINQISKISFTSCLLRGPPVI